ncbi:MAG: DUF6064 family protein [Pseudomonadota bacterium]
MSEWLSYELQDLLLFSEATYWRLLERLNAEVWPLQPVVVAVFGAALSASLLWDRARRPLLGLLAFAWLGVAFGFAPLYAEVNWAADYVAPAFVVQAIALGAFATTATVRTTAFARKRGDLRAWMGAAIAAAALVLWPFAAIPLRGSLASAEVVGLAPDPTAVATLGCLTAFGGGRFAALLCLPPLIWCGLSALTLVAMGASVEGVMIAAIPILALGALGADVALRGRS